MKPMQQTSEIRFNHPSVNHWRGLLLSGLLGLTLVTNGSALDREALLRQGNEAFLRGRVEEALAAYEQLVQIDPKDTVILYNLAVCLERAGRLEEAARAYARILELEPEHIRAAEALRRLDAASPPETASDAV